MKCDRQRKAFTVVEMVIVIAVIAILATVLVPTVAGVIQKANHSADTQFAASLNVQLAMYSVDKDIKSESDLRDAINSFYGKFHDDGTLADDGDFYASLAPKSAQQGYHYWWNATDKQVVLAKYEDLVAPAAPADATEIEPEFSPASPRSLMIDTAEGKKNFFLMDMAGSDVADVMDKLGILGGEGQDYLDVIDKLTELSNDTDSKDCQLFSLINSKLSETTIITAGGAHRYADVNNIKYIWVSPEATVLQQTMLHIYTGTDVDENNTISATTPLAPVTVTDIELPAGVNVSLGGLPGVKVDAANDYAANTKLHVQTDVIEDLQKIYATDYVLVTPNGTRYVWLGMELYTLPLTPGQGSVGSADTENLGGADVSFSIECNEGASNIGTGSVYVSGNTVYAAYNKGTVQLTLTGITSSWVDWSSSSSAVATVDDSGLVTLNLPDVGGTYETTITATYKYDNSKTASIKVYVVRPVSADVTIGANQVTLDNDEDKGTFTISYEEASDLQHVISLLGVTKNDGGYITYVEGETSANPGYVTVEKGILSYTCSRDLFAVVNDVLIIDETKINGESSADLKITYTGTKGVIFERTYTITVKDDSAVGLKKNQIATGVTMGDYLFRVGNSNSFTLSKLFSPAEDNKKIGVTAVKIYDASKTDNNGNRQPIASDSGFYAKVNGAVPTYDTQTAEYQGWTLTEDNWASSEIQFTGTGVAIIVVETTKGDVELAVEVMSGKNVNSAGDFTGSTNYVVLNDITWGSTKDIVISGAIYGNGFAINATTYKPIVSSNTAMFQLNGGTIDNLVINGPVYPEISWSGGQYYIAGVYTTGNATITNSYISGFREPIMADSSLLYVENTTLVGGVYANLWLNKGDLTLKDVTTVQTATNATVGNTNTIVLGGGIVVTDTNSADCIITLEGTLNQYNWANSDDKSYIKDDIVKSAAGVLLNNSSAKHTLSSEKVYVNTGIAFLGSRTNAINDNRTDKAAASYELLTISPGAIYTRVSPKITEVPTYDGYMPEAQLAQKPTFDHKLPLSNGEVSLKLTNGSATLNVSGYTVSKYTDQPITVTVTCSGGTIANNIITFTQAGAYTITYTVEDNTFFDNSGNRAIGTVTDTYTVKVVVSKADHKDAVIDVSGVNETVYHLTTGFGDVDYIAYISVLEGLVITDYNEDGTESPVTISANSKPAGLTFTVEEGFYGEVKETTYGKRKGDSVDSRLYIYDGQAHNNYDYGTIKVTYSYVGKNNKTVNVTKTYNASAQTKLEKESCVTSDTLVTLADGTQKRVDELTYADRILAWNLFTGEYMETSASYIVYHGDANYRVVRLNFSDGTTVKIIGEHGFYDNDLRRFVFMSEANVADYVGHTFAKNVGNNTVFVTLDSYSVAEEYTGSYSLASIACNNVMANGMFSLTPVQGIDSENFFNFLVVGENMKYDDELLQADVEKYGVFTYEELSVFMTFEEFCAFEASNGCYLKIAIGKGYITMEQLLAMLAPEDMIQ